MNSQESVKKKSSPSADLNFNVVTPDFVDHVIYKLAVSARERGIDPRHSVIVSELWNYRLINIANTMLDFGEKAVQIDDAMDKVDLAQERLLAIQEEMTQAKDEGTIDKLLEEADEVLKIVLSAMAEATDGD